MAATTNTHPMWKPPTASERSAAERRAIDETCRGPVLYFAASAVVWLLVGSLLAFIAPVKLHEPNFPNGSPELTIGTVRMAHLQAVGVGWASMAGMAAALWMMCRLCRVALVYPRLLLLAATSWNVGMVLNVLGILFGDGQSVEWLDAPRYCPPF